MGMERPPVALEISHPVVLIVTYLPKRCGQRGPQWRIAGTQEIERPPVAPGSKFIVDVPTGPCVCTTSSSPPVMQRMHGCGKFIRVTCTRGMTYLCQGRMNAQTFTRDMRLWNACIHLG